MINFCDQHVLNFWGANARDIIVFVTDAERITCTKLNYNFLLILLMNWIRKFIKLL